MAKIKLYGTKTCSYCKVAKDYFEEKDLAFTYVDIGEDAEARDEVAKATGISAVPIIQIDGKYIIGWKKAEIEEVLGIA